MQELRRRTPQQYKDDFMKIMKEDISNSKSYSF